MTIEHLYDVLIIGSGLAGQTLALSVADQKKVLIVCKSDAGKAASNYAQGGISAVYAQDDTYDKHLADTLVAGCNLNDVDATRYIIENGRSAADWLIAKGVPFTREGSSFHLTREGGHSERRILHVDDMTGRGIQKTLIEQVRSHPNITFMEDCTAIDLLTSGEHAATCKGAILLDAHNNAFHVWANATVLATGGVGAVFLHTTSPSSTIGDGVALAWRAGCRVTNLEFMQFHPTCMYFPGGEPFLITEAVRGEGGILKLADGHRFMPDYDERAELAPRDIVSRAIYSEMKKNGVPFVHLDISHQPAEFVKAHFPNIYQKCLERGIDITREPIPVTPACHYTCGGVQADTAGRTDVSGLYCIGEAAYTGLHGANRLASNSLLECVVTARAAAEDILNSNVEPLEAGNAIGVKPGRRMMTAAQHENIQLIKHEIRAAIWNYVGIVRTVGSLASAHRRLELIRSEVAALADGKSHTIELVELRNMVLVAQLLIQSAQQRKESLGCHFNSDFPQSNSDSEPTVLCPSELQISVAA